MRVKGIENLFNWTFFSGRSTLVIFCRARNNAGELSTLNVTGSMCAYQEVVIFYFPVLNQPCIESYANEGNNDQKPIEVFSWFGRRLSTSGWLFYVCEAHILGEENLCRKPCSNSCWLYDLGLQIHARISYSMFQTPARTLHVCINTL